MPASHGARSAPAPAPEPVPAPAPAVADDGEGADSRSTGMAKRMKNFPYSRFPFEMLRYLAKQTSSTGSEHWPLMIESSAVAGARVNSRTVPFRIVLGNFMQGVANTVVMGAHAYRRDPGSPPEKPHVLSIGVKFSDPVMVEWIEKFNSTLLQLIKETGVASDIVPIEKTDQVFKTPFVKGDDGYIAYFSFTDPSKCPPGQQLSPYVRLPKFKRMRYRVTGERDIDMIDENEISYEDIRPQEDYCIAVFTVDSLRTDIMSMTKNRTTCPYIGHKLYLQEMIVLEAVGDDDAAAEEGDDDTDAALFEGVNVKRPRPSE